MSLPRVLCLGEILFDFLADQPGLPYGQVQSWSSYPGGAPANVATALAKLGTTSGFVGCIGQDEIGEMLVKLLQEIGVNISGVQRHSTAPTRGVYVVRSLTGDRTFAGFGGLDTTQFADAYLQASQLPVPLFETTDFLVLGTLELAYPDSGAAIFRALDLANRSNTHIFLDVNWRTVFWTDPDTAPSAIQEIIHRADFIKMTDEEADWLFKTVDPAAIAQKLETARGETAKGVLVTAGEKGCEYWLSGNQGKLPAFSISVVDTTGAGDSFSAGFLHQLCQQGIQCLADPETAHAVVTYASATGALTTTKPGAIAAQPTAAEVAAFLQQQNNS